MSDVDGDVELSRQLAQLVTALEELQSEIEPTERRRMGLPTPRDLLRVTSEVGIPAAIVVLETNVRVLKLLQRVLRMADGRDPGAQSGGQVRDRATRLGQDALSRLDEALQDIQATAAESENGEVSQRLAEVRELRNAVAESLAAEAESQPESLEGVDSPQESIGIDVEAELDSIKSQIEDDGDDGHADDESDGNDDAGET